MNLLSQNYKEYIVYYSKDDIQRLYALNEEYNEQLFAYKEENSKVKRIFSEKLKKYKQKSTNLYENLQPEMISPEQSFKILICI